MNTLLEQNECILTKRLFTYFHQKPVLSMVVVESMKILEAIVFLVDPYYQEYIIEKLCTLTTIKYYHT